MIGCVPCTAESPERDVQSADDIFPFLLLKRESLLSCTLQRVEVVQINAIQFANGNRSRPHMAKHPLRGNRLCWLETQQSLYAPFRYAMRKACRVALSIWPVTGR
jgi:hypothetical protein